jgi:diguanylate cyclase (GGDEF)-like protein/PAS domain S-box-containing protein
MRKVTGQPAAPGRGEAAGPSVGARAMREEEVRLSSLRALNILDARPDPQLDILTKLTARQLGTPYALINLIDADLQWTKSAFGFPTGPLVGRRDSFCQHTIQTPGSPTLVVDARLDERFANLQAVTDEPGIRAYAGMPLRDANGYALGTLCVFDTEVRAFDAGAVEMLQILAQLVASRLEYHRLEAALRESEDHHRHLVELNPQLPWIASATGETEEVSARWLKITGMPEDKAVGSAWAEAVHPDDSLSTTVLWNESMEHGTFFDAEYRLRIADGSYRWFRGRGSPRRDADGTILRWYGADEDIHDRKIVELALIESERRHRFALEAGRLGTWEVDLATHRAKLSERSAHDLGLPETDQDFTRERWLAAIHPDDQLRLQDAIRVALKSRTTYELEYRSLWPDGSVHWLRASGQGVYDAEGRPVQMMGLALDITPQRKVEIERAEAEERLHHLAYHDPLTGLANRRLLHETLNDPATWAGSRLALLFLDLDHFKRINDSLGHEAGDRLLIEAAIRIKRSTRETDLVARFGGDEFAVLQRGISSAADAEALALRILETLAEPFSIDGAPVVIGGSIGLSLAPDHTTIAGQLLRNADTALYEAKAAGRGFYCLFGSVSTT